MNKEKIETTWKKYYEKANQELISKMNVKGNVINVFCEIKYDDNGIAEIQILNSKGIKHMIYGDTNEYEKDELDIFNVDGKVDNNVLRPMNFNLNTYCASIPVLITNDGDIIYPNMDKAFNNTQQKMNIEEVWKEYCEIAHQELISKMNVKGNVINVFCEIRHDDNFIAEIHVLNYKGIQHMIYGDINEYEKDELDIFNADGKVDNNTLRPMNFNLNTYCANMPVLITNDGDIIYPNMDILFNN